MDLTLSPTDQAAVHQLMLAVPQPGEELLPSHALLALSRVLPSDTIEGGECDDQGFLLRGFLSDGRFENLDCRVSDGPLRPGLQHLAAMSAAERARPCNDHDGDTLRVGFATRSQTVVQLALSRDRQRFSSRDVLVLQLVAPLLRNLMLQRPRLDAGRGLTSAELRVLEQVARGASNLEVAEQLSVTVATVRKHLENSYRKLGVRSRTAAVAALDPVDQAPSRPGRPRAVS